MPELLVISNDTNQLRFDSCIGEYKAHDDQLEVGRVYGLPRVPIEGDYSNCSLVQFL